MLNRMGPNPDAAFYLNEFRAEANQIMAEKAHGERGTVSGFSPALSAGVYVPGAGHAQVRMNSEAVIQTQQQMLSSGFSGLQNAACQLLSLG